MGSNRPLRVLIEGASMDPAWQGGDPVYAELLVRGLGQLGVDAVREGSRRTFVEFAALALTPYDAEPSRILWYRRRLRGLRPNVVLASTDYDCSLIVAARKEGIPVIVVVQIYWPTCPIGTRYIEGRGVCSTPGFSKCLRHMSRAPISPNLGLPVPGLPAPLGFVLYSKLWVRRAALSQADAIVAPSEFMATVLREAGYPRVHVIPNSVDTNLFRASPWEGPSKVVLYPVARSKQERKGYDHFVRMARAVHAKMPDVRFRILTDPGDDLIEGTSYLSHAELAEQLRAIYLAVVPGLWDEPFGTVAAEAMSAGRPVVMYDGGGSSDLIEDGVSGLLVPRGDVVGLARAVGGLLADEDKAHRMGQAARARIEARFRYPMMAERYLALIYEVLGGRRPDSVAPGRPSTCVPS